MDVFYWPGGCPPALSASVATLGVFDGVHVGHQRLLGDVLAESRRLKIPSVVVTFDPHPNTVLGQGPQPCITSPAHRLRLIDALGLDVCLVLRFSDKLAAMTAQEFARTVLRDMLGAELLIVGPDCRFGKDARGDIAMLQGMSDELGLRCRVADPVYVGGHVVSSTAIRRAILGADLSRAHDLLGRPFSLFGTVGHGSARGRELGYPTANLDTQNELVPRDGVYASLLLTGGQPRPSVTSIGTQQTFQHGPAAPRSVEIHVLDDSPDLYGRETEVQFIEYLREQVRHDGPQALAAQIARDIEAARQVLTHRMP